MTDRYTCEIIEPGNNPALDYLQRDEEPVTWYTDPVAWYRERYDQEGGDEA